MNDLLIALAISAVLFGLLVVALFCRRRSPEEQALCDAEQIAALCGDAEAEAYADYLTAKHAEAEERARELIA